MKKLELLIPPPVYTFIFLGLMYLANKYIPGYSFWNINLSYAGLALMLLGGLIGAASFARFFQEKTTASPIHVHNTNKLVVKGMYRYSRNPMYVAMLFVLIGYAMFLGSLTPFIFPILFFICISLFQIKPEERMMQQKFGSEYQDYLKKTPRWL